MATAAKKTAAKKNVVYIRSLRPNGVNITVDDLRVTLSRRGARGDTVAVPREIVENTNFQKNIKAGLIEEISHEEFLTLEERTEDAPQGKLKKPEVLYALATDDPNKVTVIEKFEADSMRPRLEWADSDYNEEVLVAELMRVMDVDADTAKKMIAIKKGEE